MSSGTGGSPYPATGDRLRSRGSARLRRDQARTAPRAAFRHFRPVIFFIFLFSSFLEAPLLQALEVPKKAQGYVSDYAGMLSPSARQELEAALAQFESETSNQVIVVTFPSLEGESLEDFSIRLAEAWKPGQKGKDNGVILLVFKNDRAVRIEVGYGLEGVLTDAVSSLIIQNEIVPEFRQGNFDNGIKRAVNAIFQSTRGEYQPERKTERPGGDLLGFGIFLTLASLVHGRFAFLIFQLIFLLLGIFLPSLFLLFVSVIIGLFAFLSGMQGGYSLGSSRGRSRSGGFGGGGFGGGGFSGGGGGFGGGGASGRW